MLTKLNQISFSYANQPLFQDLTWQINPGQRIGLLGPNGAGKSTLLRILSKAILPDQGQVILAKGKSLGYLHQSQEFQEQGTLWDALLRSFSEVLALRHELQNLEEQLQISHEQPTHVQSSEGVGPEHSSIESTGFVSTNLHKNDLTSSSGNGWISSNLNGLANSTNQKDEKKLVQYGMLQERYEHLGGYTLEARVRQLAQELGFSQKDFTRDLATFSGGERGRVELAKVLLLAPDLLLLDEPTNHLDLDAIESLEKRLQNWDTQRAFVVVSHDRYFLQNVCNEIVELAGGKLVFYKAGYEKYLTLRQERYEQLQIAYERQQEEIAQTEDFIRRNLAGQNTKQAQSRRTMLEKLERIEAPQDFYQKAGKVALRFAPPLHPGGKEVLVVKNLEIGYGHEPALIQNTAFTVYRGAKIGIIGPNGAGKSTLLKTILGKLPARQGKIELGYEIDIGYFDQKLGDLDERRTLIEEIATIKGEWNEERIRTYLGQFRFKGDQSFQKVKSLSGGERNRLTLAKMMLKPHNVLALDEPTNHLDFVTCEILEEALASFEGTVLIVSHDRYFLDKVAQMIFYVNPTTHRLEEYLGNYTGFKQQTTSLSQNTISSSPSSTGASAKRASLKKQDTPVLSSRQLQREAEKQKEKLSRKRAQLEEKITLLEKEIQELQLLAGNLDPKDWQAQNEYLAKEKDKQDQLDVLLKEWESLCLELEG